MLFQVLFFNSIYSLKTEFITTGEEENFPLPFKGSFSWSNNQIDTKQINGED